MHFCNADLNRKVKIRLILLVSPWKGFHKLFLSESGVILLFGERHDSVRLEQSSVQWNCYGGVYRGINGLD